MALIGLGLVILAAYGAFDGVWLMLLGWFLVTAAGAEALHARLEGVTVDEVMTRDPVVAPDWITVRELIDDYLMTHRCSTFPLRAFDGSISGLVTMAAVKRVPRDQRDEKRARDVAVPIDRAPTGQPDEPLSELMARLSGATDGRALVFDGDALVGIVSPADVAWADRRRALAADGKLPQSPTDPPRLSER
jgi:CBS domain-containing protein